MRGLGLLQRLGSNRRRLLPDLPQMPPGKKISQLIKLIIAEFATKNCFEKEMKQTGVRFESVVVGHAAGSFVVAYGCERVVRKRSVMLRGVSVLVVRH